MVKDENVKWHPAFFQAIQAELEEYKNSLTYEAEHQLIAEPLRMDTLIIKKPPNTKIDKNIGQIFREHNIFEYKSPDDSLLIDDYNKVFGYAYIYAALNGISIMSTTVTFVETMHPRKLMKYLKDERKLDVTEVFDGIYYVSGEVIPVQIIESKRLSESENLWVKALSNELTKATMEKILTESKQLSGEIGAYIYAILEANSDVFKEVRAMGDVSLAEVLDEMGYVERSYVDKKVQATRLETARQMLIEGDPIEKISRVTNLSVDELKILLHEEYQKE